MTKKETRRRQVAFYSFILLFAVLILRNFKKIFSYFFSVIENPDSWSAAIFHRGLFFSDFSMRWKECGYVLHGINPFENMDGLITLPQYGGISDLGGNMPWEYILGNLFNPGFVSFSVAKGWFLFMTFGIIAYSGFCGFHLLRKNGMEAKWAALAFPIILLPTYWVNSMLWGNQGALLACLAFIFICIVDEHPYFAGIVLSFIMMKPQIGALFFIVLLLTKKFKTIFTSGGILCIAWAIAALLTSTPPLTMITQMLNRGLGLNDVVVYGLFDFTRYFFSFSTGASLALSILTGILFTVIFTLKILKSKNLSQNSLFLYTPTVLASTFWFYKQPHDLVVLITPLTLCLLAFYNSGHRLKDYLIFGGSALLLCTNLWKDRFCKMIFGSYDLYMPYINMIDSLLIVFAGAVILAYFTEQNNALPLFYSEPR